VVQYDNEIATWFFGGEVAKIQGYYDRNFKDSVSFHDIPAEGFLHGYHIGLLSGSGVSHITVSNMEAGDGRFDLMMIPKPLSEDGSGKKGAKDERKGLIIEFKALPLDKSKGDKAGIWKALAKSAEEGIKQILTKQYYLRLQSLMRGAKSWRGYGVSYCKKTVLIICKEFDFNGQELPSETHPTIADMIKATPPGADHLISHEDVPASAEESTTKLRSALAQ